LDWEGSDKYCSANKVRSSVVHCRGVKPQDKTTTQSIATLVNADNTEVVNKQINKSKSRLVNLTSYRNDNLVVDATSVAVNSSQIQQENKYHSEHRRNRLVTMTTENHNHLTIRTVGLSGDNDDRECERWKESQQMILLR
jgi:hypothetical protein